MLSDVVRETASAQVSSVSAYVVGLIAVSGTILGAVVAGIFQRSSLVRQLKSQTLEAERKRLAELEHWAHAALEDRHKMLWTERKAFYTRLIGPTEEWIRSNIDLFGTELPKGVNVQNHDEAANASPVVARHFEVSNSFEQCLYEIEILGHSEVVVVARDLHLALIRGAKAALDGKNERDKAEAAKRRLLTAMRRRLTEASLPSEA